LSVCTENRPPLADVSADHKVRCWLYTDSNQHSAPLKNGQP